MARRAAARGDVSFTAFLNEREEELARAALCAYKEVFYTMWGGYPQAQRNVLAICGYETPPKEAFSIKTLLIRCNGAKQLTHRDFLGALMGLGISRDCVGDILVRDGREAVCYLTVPAAALCIAETFEIGHFPAAAEPMEPIEETVAAIVPQAQGAFFAASLRLDAMLSGMLRTGRAKAEEMIRKGLVQVNHMQMDSRSFLLQDGDIVTIRGYGKYKLSQTGGKSKKGRLYLEWVQY